MFRRQERPGPARCGEVACDRTAAGHLTGFSWQGDRPSVVVCTQHVARYERLWGQVMVRPIEPAQKGRGWHGLRPPRGGWTAA
jgi:hypothetical protein